jgi:hypothetical protein
VATSSAMRPMRAVTDLSRRAHLPERVPVTPFRKRIFWRESPDESAAELPCGPPLHIDLCSRWDSACFLRNPPGPAFSLFLL